ncbi:transposable element Tcb2 transposase [Trichonephila clavipes]|nr:transposable element Tcb2 transposase [Trichonephila clavipes]
MSFTQRPGSRRPRQTSSRENRLIIKNARVQPTASSTAIQAQVAPSLGAPVSSRNIRVSWLKDIWDRGVHYVDESRFNLSIDDNRVHELRPLGECLNPAFALQRHTAPTAGVMIWVVNAYNTQSPLLFICFTMIAQRYVHDILQPHVLPLTQGLPGATRQCSVSHGKGATRLSPHCSYLFSDCRSPDLSEIEHIWDHLGRRVRHPTSLNELGARLQQIWNEMSQDIIQNLYASMADRIAMCIRARGGLTGY